MLIPNPIEPNPTMSSSFSSSRPLQQLIAVSRLKSSTVKKLPEPLRRAVADCLSSPLSPSNEPSRTLQDYLKALATTDLAYNAILEHTIAERERSPAVVTRCVALLKRYLLRYKPSEETLIQIDLFCSTMIAECDINPTQPWSLALNRQSGASNTSPLPVSTFASESLVKSLSYVRSLVAQHIPKRLFQPASFAGPPSSGQSLPTLSSLLSKSFNSQLTPASIPETPSSASVPKTLEKDSSALSVSRLSKIEKANETDELGFIAHDVLKWRWLEEPQSSSIGTENDRAVNSQDMTAHSFLEIGAAALLVGDIESKMKGQPWKFFGTDDMPYLDQLLQSSPVTPITNSDSARPHLRAITASKRTKPGSRQIWEDFPVTTFRPRARQLFQYRHYSEQQPLRLNPAEVQDVIAAVCSEAYSPNTNATTASTRLSNNSGKPSTDVAVSVLIKLIIDMYVLDSQTAAPLILSMLEDMLSSSKTACRVRAFDLILNLAVHAHLLEPIIADDASTIEEEYSQESYYDSDTQVMVQGSSKGSPQNKSDTGSAIDKFESWILNILYEILLLLVQSEEKDESVWASALSCLLYFVCDRGKIKRNRLRGLDIRVLKALVKSSRENSWAELVHCKLISMLTNMFYEVAESVPGKPKFLVDQLDLIGGVQFIFIEYSLANSREERKNLYLVLFDYILHQINETCIASGVNEYNDDEIQPLAALLAQTNAPEAFYISVKLGVEGIGEILRRSIASALSRYPNSERLNMMCDILFSQLCLRVPPAAALTFGDDVQHGRNSNHTNVSKRFDGDNHVKQDTFHWDGHMEEANRRSGYHNNYHLDHETASMAALFQGRAVVPMQLIARVPAAILYWPLIQLAGAATDDIALGVAVGSKGRGNLPGATSDIRATLLLLLIGKCTADPVAFQEVGQEQFFRELLDDTDSRVAYYSSAFLLKRMMTENPEKYQHMLQNLVVKAQQSNNEKLLENPYLQMCGILQLANDLGIDL
ncbi:hypothetical protein GLYMA_18G288500v4 [Glycine max]|uniref:Uncharacterized protein n=1 Tax=Glycine max TaxID=3847 RepID=A0A0R0FEH5_SOYBN|nr:hypothetical protein GYH30_051433 [Glycine max]KRH01619.1 hypothetical protein GLYMA_18G288500v4 [Glycine max]|eukprot:XP_014626405.1 uncharacterized protein LOC100800748 isoform X2 [Glycine max]